MIKSISLLFYLFCFFNSSNSQPSGWFQQRYQNVDSLLSIFFINPQSGWTCGKNGLLLKTTNGGSNWIQESSGFNNTLEKVCFPSADIGYIVGEGGIILKTTTGGMSWVQQNSGSTGYLKSISFVNDSLGYIAGLNNTLLKTTNSGNDWNYIFIDDSLEFFSIDFVNELTGWVSSRVVPVPLPMTQPGMKIYKTTNGASNWFLQYERTTEYSPLLSLNFVNSSYGWVLVKLYIIAVTEIIKTSNGGITWSASFIGPNEYNSISFVNERKGWAVGDYNGPVSTGIKITTTGGLDWSYQNNPGAILHSVFFIDSLTGWAAGENGNILKTTTGGILTNFNNNTSEIPDKYFLSQNYPNPFNPKTIISYQLSTFNFISLKVYNVLGNEVATLVNEKKNTGSYEVEFEGSEFPSGVYFYSLEIDGNLIDTKRMLLLK